VDKSVRQGDLPSLDRDEDEADANETMSRAAARPYKRPPTQLNETFKTSGKRISPLFVGTYEPRSVLATLIKNEAPPRLTSCDRSGEQGLALGRRPAKNARFPFTAVDKPQLETPSSECFCRAPLANEVASDRRKLACLYNTSAERLDRKDQIAGGGKHEWLIKRKLTQEVLSAEPGLLRWGASAEMSPRWGASAEMSPRTSHMDWQFGDVIGQYCYKDQSNSITKSVQCRRTKRVTPNKMPVHPIDRPLAPFGPHQSPRDIRTKPYH
jgi:hypothetical protein